MLVEWSKARPVFGVGPRQSESNMNRSSLHSSLLRCVGAVFLTAVWSVAAGAFSLDGEAAPSRSVAARETGGDPGCAGAEQVTVTADVDLVLTGDTSGGVSDVEGYGCEPWRETGPEAVYLLQVEEPTNLYVSLASPAELDVFLLSECDADACLAAHIREFLVELAPRTEPYVLVIDGYLGAAGPYTLVLQGYAAGVPAGVCAEALPVSCTPAGTVLTDGNLFALPNRLLSASCGSYLEPGGEQWYALEIPGRHELDVTLLDLFFDGALWLFDGCDATAACIGYADASPGEGVERIVLLNDAAQPVVWYLAVDAFQAVDTANGFIESDGVYSLDIQCESRVPTERHDWGVVKSLYR
jgi:hypothetical protein